MVIPSQHEFGASPGRAVTEAPDSSSVKAAFVTILDLSVPRMRIRVHAGSCQLDLPQTNLELEHMFSSARLLVGC